MGASAELRVGSGADGADGGVPGEPQGGTGPQLQALHHGAARPGLPPGPAADVHQGDQRAPCRPEGGYSAQLHCDRGPGPPGEGGPGGGPVEAAALRAVLHALHRAGEAQVRLAGLGHSLRVQQRRPHRLHPLPGEAPVQRVHLLAHLPVHGVRGAVRREDHGQHGSAPVQDLHHRLAELLHLPGGLLLQPEGAHLQDPGQLRVQGGELRPDRPVPQLHQVLPGDRLARDIRPAPQCGPDLPREGGDCAVRHAGRDAAQGRRGLRGGHESGGHCV
mmetsp:Transcript_2079/g.4902  ORF Transcript_2079/g.4902 Transcript_2079/m.4902 type:complete len:275 (-) Transcript_2079:977-1801(-)